MSLRHLNIFVVLCDKMNMTKAAEVLFISQSAVSQTISELESYYGIHLFERLSRKLYLTEAGEKLLSYARHIIGLNEELDSNMKSLSEKSSIRVGASVTVGAYVLPKLVSIFQGENSEVEVSVFEENTNTVEKMLLRNEIDLGLVEGETNSTDIVSEEFMEDELILICCPEHRFAKGICINPSELQKEKFIIREEGSGTRKTFEDRMKEKNLTWKTSWICNNTDTIKIVVKENLGVAVISRNSVRDELLSGALCEVSIKNMKFKRNFKIIYHKNKYITDTMKKFIHLCKNKAML